MNNSELKKSGDSWSVKDELVNYCFVDKGKSEKVRLERGDALQVFGSAEIQLMLARSREQQEDEVGEEDEREEQRLDKLDAHVMMIVRSGSGSGRCETSSGEDGSEQASVFSSLSGLFW